MSTSPAQHGKPALHPAPHTPGRRRRWGLCFILATVLLLLCVVAVAVSYSLVASLLGADTPWKRQHAVGSQPRAKRLRCCHRFYAGDQVPLVPAGLQRP